MKKRKKHKPEIKLQAVIDSFISGNVSQTAADYGVHISMLEKWRKKLIAEGATLFENKRRNNQYDKSLKSQLERIIGRQAIQIDILKKTQEYVS